jgi:hypothetical protein
MSVAVPMAASVAAAVLLVSCNTAVTSVARKLTERHVEQLITAHQLVPALIAHKCMDFNAVAVVKHMQIMYMQTLVQHNHSAV